MSLLLESLRLERQQLPARRYHWQRMERSATAVYGKALQWSPETWAQQWLSDNAPADEQVYKLRLCYDADGLHEVSCQPYHRREIRYLQLIDLPRDFDYVHKYAQRTYFEQITASLTPFTEALFLRNGYLTDTSYTNIALSRAGGWYTPTHPLLGGTQRAYLLEKKIIQILNIHQEDMCKFEYIMLFNALMPFEKAILLPIKTIFC